MRANDRRPTGRLALVSLTAVVSLLAGCAQTGRPRGRASLENKSRYYVSARPTYDATRPIPGRPPARPVYLGGYAGYNYPQEERRILSPTLLPGRD